MNRLNPGQVALRGAIRTYQLTLRPIIGSHCRHYPHCSEYGLEAVAEHGALRGAWLTARRVLRCNPWHEGGFDPVPPARDSKTSQNRGALRADPG